MGEEFLLSRGKRKKFYGNLPNSLALYGGSMTQQPKLILCTTDSHSSAKQLARNLVEKKLVACVNIVPNMTSVYSWQGQIHEDEEWLMLIKSTYERFGDIKDFVSANHPYDSPELISINIEDGLPDYLTWIQDSVK
jgi:periplasmic divalent cation tolerance protein